MDEAERLCDRIAIVDNGKIIALDSPSGLKRMVAGSDRVEVEIDGDAAFIGEVLKQEAYLREVELNASNNQLTLCHR